MYGSARLGEYSIPKRKENGEISDIDEIGGGENPIKEKAKTASATIAPLSEGQGEALSAPSPLLGRGWGRLRGYTHYELTNHLGNVLAVVTDRKLIQTGAAFYTADVLTLTDYYAFGQAITERTYNATAYKYGYNGKEKDNELYGEGNAYDFGARINDPRLGRWLSLDPLAAKYPSMSPYNSMADNPILYKDPDGRDAMYTIIPGIDGKNGTVKIQVVFNIKGGHLAGETQAGIADSWKNTWGNGSAKSDLPGDGTYTYFGSPINDVEIGGKKYNVSYELIIKEVPTETVIPKGENELIVNEKAKTSNYSDGILIYKPSQEASASAKTNTCFGHELSHVMGMLHDFLSTGKSVKSKTQASSISSYGKDRSVIMSDVIYTIKEAVTLAEQNNANNKSVQTRITLDTGKDIRVENIVEMDTSSDGKASRNYKKAGTP